MITSQDLFQKVAFDRPVSGDDGHGGRKQGWGHPDDAVQERAHFRFLRGSEVVQAARLQGRQPVVVTVRNNPGTGQIDASWRMRDVQTGIVYAIRSGPVPTDDRQYLEFTVESGVAE
jgi:head-tail adaptor